MTVSRARAWLTSRPALEHAVALTWLSRLGCGFISVVPLVEVAAESGLAALEQGDRALFRPGGQWLAELVVQEHRALAAAVEASFTLFVLSMVVLAFPGALLFVTSASRQTPLRAAARSALGLTPRFVAVGVVQGLAMALVLAPVLLTASAIASSTPAWATEFGMDALGAALVGIGVALAAGLVVITDLTRAALAQGTGSLRAAFSAALHGGARRARPLAGGYVLACGSGALAVALAARAVELCGVEQGGSLRLTAVTLIHAATLLGLVVIEAAWLRRVVACSTPEPPAQGGSSLA